MNMRKFILTALTNGGGSYNLFTGETDPPDGYMVSLKGHEQRVDKIDWEVVRNYVSNHAFALTRPDAYFGLWESDQWVMDVSINELDLNKAIELAIEHDQETIWDCAAKQVIQIKGAGNQAVA
jgi:hypothetical protein